MKMSKSLVSAFEIEKRELNEEIINDYDIFPDKDLLENLRTFAPRIFRAA